MKKPIEHVDIRKGELIRFEWDEPSNPHSAAYEWIAASDKDGIIAPGQHFLLRERPVCDVPATRTLGYLSWRNNSGCGKKRRVLATWWFVPDNAYVVSDLGHTIPPDTVTGFEPVAVVPAAAIQALRAENNRAGYEMLAVRSSASRRDAIYTFLAAAANKASDD